MTEAQFLQLYRRDLPFLNALGSAISSEVQGRAVSAGLDFVMPPTTRTKSESSILQKAFYRSKKYSDLYEDITDKVGVRFVTLSVDRVHTLEAIVEALDAFHISRDRDFDEERRRNPTVFVYQSVHYVMRPKNPVEFGGTTIPAGLPCEVQLRTVLQHAYSELTHDTIYKPRTYAEPEVHRLAARSMALIETTDAIFCDAARLLSQSSEGMDPMTRFIVSTYSPRVPFQTEAKLTSMILDSCRKMIASLTEDQLRAFVDDRPSLLETISRRGQDSLLFRQPVILVLYYLAVTSPKLLSQEWPLPARDLDPVFADLGVSRAI